MRSNKLIIRIIQHKKEIYYPIFTISISYFLSWLITLFVSFADSQVALPFFFWNIATLILIYSLDVYRISKKREDSLSKKLIFFLLLLSLTIHFIVVLRLVSLIFTTIYYLIPIGIYILVSILIFFVLRKEVIKYYLKKNKQIKNNLKTAIKEQKI